MADTDELYSVKNNFWLGNFQVSHDFVGCRPLRISSVHLTLLSNESIHATLCRMPSRRHAASA